MSVQGLGLIVVFWYSFGCSFEDGVPRSAASTEFQGKELKCLDGTLCSACFTAQNQIWFGIGVCERGVNRRRWRFEGLLVSVERLGGLKYWGGVSGTVPGEKLGF